MDFLPYALERAVQESEDVRTFVLSPKGGQPLGFSPGNFFLLGLLDGGGRRVYRSYSAASLPDGGKLSFCIKRKGAFSQMLFSLREGDEVGVSGPYGIFTLAESDSERVFIAGGVGIAPLRSMILQTLGEGKRCALFHSAKTFAELTYYEEMQGLAAQGRLSFFASITREEPPSGWKGLSGRITAETIAEKLGGLSGKTYYLCGTKEMCGQIAEGLKKAGVSKENVRKEEWE